MFSVSLLVSVVHLRTFEWIRNRKRQRQRNALHYVFNKIARAIGWLLPFGRLLRLVSVYAVLTLVSNPQIVWAQPEYVVNVTFPGGPGLQTSNTPGLTVDGSGNSGNLYGVWYAQANRGSLTAMSDLAAFGSYPAPNVWGSSAGFTYDDVIFSSASSVVDAVLQLQLNGALSLFDGNDIYGEFGLINVAAELNSQQRSGFAEGSSATGTGMLSGFGPTGDFNQVITASFSNIPTNQPVDLNVWLSADVWGGDGAFGDGQAYANSDFTLSFVSGGPLFDLPAGTTVNSVQGNIVNNRWAIPEPVSGWVCIFALVGLRFRRCGRNGCRSD